MEQERNEARRFTNALSRPRRTHRTSKQLGEVLYIRCRRQQSQSEGMREKDDADGFYEEPKCTGSAPLTKTEAKDVKTNIQKAEEMVRKARDNDRRTEEGHQTK